MIQSIIIRDNEKQYLTDPCYLLARKICEDHLAESKPSRRYQARASFRRTSESGWLWVQSQRKGRAPNEIEAAHRQQRSIGWEATNTKAGLAPSYLRCGHHSWELLVFVTTVPNLAARNLHSSTVQHLPLKDQKNSPET